MFHKHILFIYSYIYFASDKLVKYDRFFYLGNRIKLFDGFRELSSEDGIMYFYCNKFNYYVV